MSAVAPGSGTPTGTVTFYDGGSPIASGTLIGGVSTFTTSALAGGNRTITTSYGGDGNFNGSTGSLTGNPQVVNTAPTVTSPTSTNITSSSATLGGTVTADGGASITQRGILYSLTSVNPSPTKGGNGVTEADDSSDSTGTFTEAVSGLTPGLGYSFVAFAKNSVGTAYTSPVSTFTTLSPPQPTITPSSLPEGDVNVSYDQTIGASGGSGTLTLAVSNIQNAIPGIDIPSSGTGSLSITGTPTATGTETFTVTVTDANGATGDQNYSLTINPSLTLTNSTVPDGSLDEPYSSDFLQASGGIAPYAFSASGLPSGLNINSVTGSVYGTPTVIGTSTVNFTVTDSVYATSKSLDMTIDNNADSITAYSLDGVNGTVDSAVHSVAVTVPYGTDVSNLAADFTLSPGATAYVNNTLQQSGQTTNDLTSAVAYVVYAQDGVHKQDWTVTCTVQQPNSPELASISPAYSLTGSIVTLNGSNFGSVTGSVYFSQGSSLYKTSGNNWSDDSVQATVPSSLLPSSVNVAVYNSVYGLTSNWLPCGVTPPEPEISPDGGTYTGSQNVTIANIASGDTAYYTTNNSDPRSLTNTAYTGSFAVSQTETVNAAVYDNAGGWSAVASAAFTINSSNNSGGGGGPAAFTPNVQTEAASSITASSAVLSGDIVSDDNSNITDYGFLWGTSDSSLTNKLDVGTDNHSGVFTATLDNLTAGTTYYFQAYASNAMGTSQGTVMSFTAGAAQTLTVPPIMHAFSDVPASSWAYDAIASLSGQGYITGYPDGTFKPSNNITRAEFANMLVKALGLNANGTNGTFTDVTPDSWCYGYINDAASNNLVLGMGDNLFAPNALITREQMAVMVAKALGSKAPAVNGNELDAFSDRSAVSSWAVTGMEEAVKAGIVSGMTPTTLAPLDNATRAQAAAMIYKLLGFLGK